MSYRELDELISSLSILPGVGKRSAARMALFLLKDQSRVGKELFNKIKVACNALSECSECLGPSSIETKKCIICSDETRENKLCIVDGSIDVWAFESSGVYNGTYYLVNGIYGMESTQSLYKCTEKLQKKIINMQYMPQEIIVAIKDPLRNQLFCSFLRKIPENKQIRITRPAFGLPIGRETDYVDSATIGAALRDRKDIVEDAEY